MKQNSKKLNIYLILIPLIIFLIIKILWVLVEFLWLPAVGVDHISSTDTKPLYYRVKLAQENYKSAPLQAVVRKPVSSIRDFKLLAVYSSSKDAVITITYKNKTKVLGIGDTLNGFKFVKAFANSAIFSKNNKDYILELPKSKAQNSYHSTKVSPRHRIHTKGTTNSSSNGVIRDIGNRKVIDKDTFQHFSTHIDEVYKNIAIRDIRQGDKILFQVSFIKKDSIFSKLGLQRGDIIKSVNGEELDNYNKAFDIYRRMKNIDNLTITVIRNSQEMELEYEIN